MTITQFFLKHSNLYALARVSGIYELYNKLLHIKTIEVDGNDGMYEPETTKYLTDTLKSKDAFIDCGANVGYFSVLASSLIKQGKIFAFEPVKSTFKILRNNTKKHPNIIAINKAVGSAPGKTIINLNDGGSTIVKIKGKEKEEVRITTLDGEFPKGIPNLRVIKIDVEGMEKEVLLGGQELIKRYKPDIIFEFNYALLYTKNRQYNEVFDLLKKMGYHKFIELETGKNVKSHKDLSNSSENILAKLR